MKRHRSVAEKVLLDIVAPLALYRGEVSRVFVASPASDVETSYAKAREQRVLRAANGLNRRQRRAFSVMRADGKDADVALSLARRRP